MQPSENLQPDRDPRLSGAPDESCSPTPSSKTENPIATVLIVEDDFLIGMQTEDALVDAGLSVVGIATTAEEAVLLARQHRPSLVLMDIRLAGRRDGIDAAAQLFRELGIRCLFATAHDDVHTRARAEQLQPLGWLAKPYTMPSLVALVREAVARIA